MTILSKSDFATKWLANFPNNKTGLISESRMRDFTQDIKDSFAADGGTTPPPAAGVVWVTLPTYTTVGNIHTESAASINQGGTVRNAIAQQLNVPYATAGKKRLDSVVLNFTGSDLIYQRISGTEVNVYAIAARAAIPNGVLFVRDLEVTDGQIGQAATGAIKSIKIGATTYTPNASGLADLGIIQSEGEGQSQTLKINTRTSSYTLALSDAGNMVDMNVAGANTLTVPPVSAVAFPYGSVNATQLIIGQSGLGQTTLVAGSGVTFQSFGNQYKLAGQFAAVTMIHVAQNVWRIMGNTTA